MASFSSTSSGIRYIWYCSQYFPLTHDKNAIGSHLEWTLNLEEYWRTPSSAFCSVFLIRSRSRTRIGVTPDTRTRMRLPTQWRWEKPGALSLSWSRSLLPTCASTSFPYIRKRHPVSDNQSKLDLHQAKSHISSNHSIRKSNTARQTPYISRPAWLTRLYISSWSVDRYNKMPNCGIRLPSTFEPLFLSRFQKGRYALTCSSSLMPNMFRKNLYKSDSDICVTMSPWRRAVKHDRGNKSGIWSL